MRKNLETSKKLEYLSGLIPETFSSEFRRLASKARNDSVEIGKQDISLSEFEANTLFQLIRMNSCSTFAELGSLTGYSALFIMEALNSNGTLYCFEKDTKWISKLEDNLNKSLEFSGNLNKSFQIVQGDAIENLNKIRELKQLKFDGIFIDANKSAYLEYLNISLELLNPGGIIIADNVFLGGSVWGEKTDKFSSKQIMIMQEFNKKICDHKSFDSLILDTSDGMIFAKKNNKCENLTMEVKFSI